jgi:peptidoglycan/xylan/chitin deacetylase (PgdA/CDA1 family)
MTEHSTERRSIGPLQRLRASAAPLAKTALMRAGAYAAIRHLAPSRGLAILRYHAVCGPEGYDYADPFICVSPENFERHVAYLTSAYNVMRLEEAVEALRTNALPPNAVAITFDDGYADNLTAARILARYGGTATFYITAACLAGGQPFWPAELRYLIRALPSKSFTLDAGPAQVTLDLRTAEGRRIALKVLTRTFKAHPIGVREELRQQLRAAAGAVDIPRVMLTWSEVREMRALGMTIGSHTMTHPNLPNAGLAAAREELTASRARLEEQTNAQVTMFSYPNGGADRYQTAEVRQLVREAGYAAATTSRNAFAAASSDVYALERIEVEERLEDLVFALEVERFAFAPVPRPGEVA